MALWKFKISLHIALVFILKCNCLEVIPRNPLTNLSLIERIEHFGYSVDLHSITTQDGYILSLYRVPSISKTSKYKKNNQPRSQKSAVLLLHGMTGSPGNYFLMGNESLALYLADKGFDVWTLCSRGVRCSHEQMHTEMDWKNQNYWKYTLHEMAIYDVAATIDYILNKTEQSKLFMVGHSAGNTIQFILLSELPQYNEKIKIGTALGPTAFLGLSEDPLLKLLASLVNFIKVIYFRLLRIYEAIPRSMIEMMVRTAREGCYDQVLSKVCIKFITLIGSHRSLLVDYEKLLPLMLADAGYTLSAMELFHYSEIINSGKFLKFDYGNQNMKIYGQMTPPSYNLTNIICPMALFYAPHDAIASVQSVRKLRRHLPNVIMDYMVPFRRFTHTDFIFAHNASKLVYQPIAKMFKDYDEGKIYPKINVKRNKG